MARKSEAQIRFSANTSEFRNGIKEMNNSIKTMNNELKLNAQQLKGNANDVGLLEDKQRILQQQLEASAQKIQYTEKALEELKKTDDSTEVFKQAGTLLIKVEYADALADMEDKLETLGLRKQTMARQEERVMKKLEEMQTSIQSVMQGMGQ